MASFRPTAHMLLLGHSRSEAEVKLWEAFPEAEPGSLLWSDEFDYTGEAPFQGPFSCSFRSSGSFEVDMPDR